MRKMLIFQKRETIAKELGIFLGYLGTTWRQVSLEQSKEGGHEEEIHQMGCVCVLLEGAHNIYNPGAATSFGKQSCIRL